MDGAAFLCGRENADVPNLTDIGEPTWGTAHGAVQHGGRAGTIHFCGGKDVRRPTAFTAGITKPRARSFQGVSS